MATATAERADIEEGHQSLPGLEEARQFIPPEQLIAQVGNRALHVVGGFTAKIRSARRSRVELLRIDTGRITLQHETPPPLFGSDEQIPAELEAAIQERNLVEATTAVAAAYDAAPAGAR